MRAIPRDYQLDIINAAESHFINEERGQLILPCGAGKTLVSLWVKEKIQSKFTLFCVPSLALLRQTKDEWAKHQNSDVSSFFICSEDDIDKRHDDLVIDIHEFGTNVSTTPEVISNFITQNQDGFIIYSTYHSLPSLIDAVRIANFTFDLIICDEAHKTTGKKDSTFSLIHDNNLVPAARRLYMTATPRVSTKFNYKDPDAESFIYDMSNTNVYGKVFYEMSFATAIQLGILVDYKVIIIGINDEYLEKVIKSGKITEDGTPAEIKAHHYALDKAMQDYNIKHVISFHSRVKAAEVFSIKHTKMFPDKFCKSLSGKDTTSIREKYIHKFITADTGVLSNARCLTEGVDIPDIDAVYFCDPKSSTVDIVQAIGRALRKPRNKITKDTGYIILPLYYSNLDNLDNISENDSFSNIIDVLRAMSNHDERLKAELLSGWNSSGDHIIKTDLINSILSIENFDILIKNKITAEIINFIVDIWNRRLQEYKGWIGQHGLDPKWNKNNEVEFKLATWAGNQRLFYKAGKLAEDRILALQSIGFRFENINDKTWDEQLQKYEDWIGQHGLDPKWNKNNEAEFKLATWARSQRRFYKAGKLAEDRVLALQSIGFRFENINVMTDWSEKLQEYKNWIDQYGCKPRQNKYNEVEFKLATWAGNQRLFYKAGKLAEDRILALQSIGFRK